MKTDRVTFQVRLPNELHAKLRAVAKRELRSKNGEIEYMITRYIEEYERLHGEPISSPYGKEPNP